MRNILPQGLPAISADRQAQAGRAALHLARIFHRVSTTAAQSGMSTALRLFGRLDILSNSLALPSQRALCIHARLRPLATKPYEKYGLAAALLIFFLIPLHAAPAYDYTIDSYQIIMKVNENNSFEITENINVFFNIPRHGIERLIPLRNNIVRLDGTKSRNQVIISGVQVNENFTTYNESGNRVLRIGDPDETIRGAKLYTIQYTYDIGSDTGKGYDELYFNLIGTDWDTSIDNIVFMIIMPKSFDKEKLGFSAGALYSSNSENIDYEIEGNVINGRYNGALGPGEGLTVRLELPEGYFIKTPKKIDVLTFTALLLPLIFLILYFMLWRKYGRNGQVIETVEFYPPQGLNSAETGFWYKGRANNEDIISLLIYLANKGYLKISEKESTGMFNSRKGGGFTITKIKDYDGDNENEKVFIEGLFQNKTSIVKYMEEMLQNKASISNSDNTITEVSDTDLCNRFYITLGKISSNINSRKNRERVFEKSSMGKSAWGILMILAIFFVITIKPVLEYTDVPILALIFPLVGFIMLICAVIWMKGIVKWFLILWGAGFGGLPWCFMVLPALMYNSMYLLANGIGLACIIGIMILTRNMPKRTPLGNEMLGKIRGFRNFLILAEKPKLEELVAGNPEYYYNILPFTYVLGVSDKWIKKFETIALAPPSWYSGRSTFSNAAFGSFMNSTMKSANSAMSSSPSSGSGGSSGGGSSGGGSGGGGGRSW